MLTKLHALYMFCECPCRPQLTVCRPTASPTSDPSPSPTIPFCKLVNVDIVDFEAVSSDEIEDDLQLQDVFANVSHHAIAQSASDDGLAVDDFYVFHVNVSGDSEYVEDGLEWSLFFVQNLCAFDEQDLRGLVLVINNEGDEMAVAMADRLATLFLDGNSSDSMTVSIYTLTEFSYLHLGSSSTFRQFLRYICE